MYDIGLIVVVITVVGLDFVGLPASFFSLLFVAILVLFVIDVGLSTDTTRHLIGQRTGCNCRISDNNELVLLLLLLLL